MKQADFIDFHFSRALYFPAIFLHSSRISFLNLAGFITVMESPKPIAQENTICFWFELNFRRTEPSSCCAIS